jgi:PHP family Zn ribbon phosphoesterase
MGEYADMILEGDVCQVCMCPLKNSLGDFPQTCGSCKRADAREVKTAQRVACKTCGKRVKLAGVKDHMRDAHGSQP